MKISTDSWHYKLVDFIFKESWPSESLCIYFWQVVWSCIVTFLTSCMGTVILACIIYVFLYEPIVKTVEGSLGVYSYWLVWVFFCQKALKHLPEDNVVGEIFRYTPWTNKNVDKEPNIVLEYIRAKKQKFCPKIDFV